MLNIWDYSVKNKEKPRHLSEIPKKQLTLLRMVISSEQSPPTKRKRVWLPFKVEEIINTTRASFSAIESLREGRWVEVKD